MNYHFQSFEPIDEKVMIRAMRKCPRSASNRSSYWLGFGIGVLEGAIFALGMIVLAKVLLRFINVSSEMPRTVVPLFGVLLAFLVTKLSARFKLALHVRRMLWSPIYKGNMNFDLSSDGLEMSGSNVKWSVSWPAIEKVMDDRDAIFFYAGAFSYVLPKRALGETKASDVLKSVEGWRNQGAAS
ncbi:YcxB family protein [Leisingera thetidis]|uniref:YcxB family protein n=1 Tax=Leisingera thetidis TaxID=2930199 RepID=UPI0021F727C2|nr:YcxB family protein [Leisingera thetidis]